MGILEKLGGLGGGAAKIASAAARVAGQSDIANKIDEATYRTESAVNTARQGVNQMKDTRKKEG